jgi:hypothetical protein
MLEASYSQVARRPPKDPVKLLTGLVLQPLVEAPSWRHLALRLNEPQFRDALRITFNHNDFSKFTLLIGPQPLERIFEETVRQLKRRLPTLGQTVAVDSTLIEAFANPGKQGSHSRERKSWPEGDPEAQWTKTRDNNGTSKWVFGFKIHGAVCADYWLPLAFLTTPASNGDSPFYIPLSIVLLFQGHI